MSSRGLTLQDKNQGTALMSACIVAAQAVMVPIAMLVGRKADIWGRKPLFLAGFAILSLRSFLYPDAPPKPTDSVEPFVLSITASLRRAGKGVRLVIGNGAAKAIDDGLASLIARAIAMAHRRKKCRSWRAAQRASTAMRSAFPFSLSPTVNCIATRPRRNTLGQTFADVPPMRSQRVGNKVSFAVCQAVRRLDLPPVDDWDWTFRFASFGLLARLKSQ
jgi:MFS family permease